MDLGIDAVDCAEPYPREGVYILEICFGCFLVGGVFVHWTYNESESGRKVRELTWRLSVALLCMGEYWAAFVEEVVDAELEAASDDPAECAVVVVNHVIDEKRVIELERESWGVGHWRSKVSLLEDVPEGVDAHELVLEKVLHFGWGIYKLKVATVDESQMVRQSKFHARKNASASVSWRCSTSSSSSSSGSVGASASGFGRDVGFQVAAEGIDGPDSAGVITRPSAAKMASASAATAAMACARSSLNCFLSIRRRSLYSSAVDTA